MARSWVVPNMTNDVKNKYIHNAHPLELAVNDCPS